MGKNATSPLLNLIRRVTEDQRIRKLTDQELLGHFRADQDETAFRGLVQRHGAMVLDVCRNVLRNDADAEDAFQATFLVLAQDARTIRKKASVASWLYAVAYRTALSARTNAAKRRKHEARRSDPQPAVAPRDPTWPEVQQVLHEELNRVSDCYRAPLVLCYLEGRTQDEAAAALGVSKATVKRWLERGRALLRVRLARRGLGSMAVLVTAVWPVATALARPVPALISSTVKAATRVAAGQAAGAGAISARVAALTQGVLQAMFLTRLKVVTAALVTAGLLACGLLVAILRAQPATAAAAPAQAAEAKSGNEKKPRPAPKPTGSGTLLLAGERGKLAALDPDGRKPAGLNTPKDTHSTSEARLSPDGTRAAFVIMDGPARGPLDDLEAPWPYKVVIRKLGATEAKIVDFMGFGVDMTWSADGKRLAVTQVGKDRRQETLLLDPETGKTEPLNLPDGARILDWARDGKTFLVVYRKDKQYRLGLAEKGDKEARELTALKLRFTGISVGRFSPDGTKVLFTDADPGKKDAHHWHRSSQPHVLTVATGKRQPLADFPENAQCVGLAWSPDGKRVAYTWTQLHAEVLKKRILSPPDVAVQTESFLIVADADGTNARTVASGRSDSALNPIFGSIDWR
jgi:RNA polymerase sigma factor (sigma-70 family)